MLTTADKDKIYIISKASVKLYIVNSPELTCSGPNNFIFSVCFRTGWCALTLKGTKTIEIHLNLENSAWQSSHFKTCGGQ